MVDTVGPRALARVPRDSWSTTQALGTGPSWPGQPFNPAGLRTRARITRDSWWTPHVFGPITKSPGRAGRTRGPSGVGPSCPERSSTPQDIAPKPDSHGRAGRTHGTSDPSLCGPGELVEPAVPGSRAGVARDIWLTPRGLGHGRESPGGPGRPCGASGTGLIPLGQSLVSAGPRTWACVAGDSDRPRGPSDPGPSHPGRLVDPACLWTQTQVTRDS